MTSTTDSRTLLFADICQSTAVYESLGDHVADRVISSALSMLGDVAHRHQGRVIKTIGDEIMTVFPSAGTAYRAADAMHGAGLPLDLVARIGIHSGEVIERDGDAFGDTVIVARRVASLARAREILMTEATFADLPESYRIGIQSVGRTPLKGRSDSVVLYSAVADLGSATVAGITAPIRSGPQSLTISRESIRHLVDGMSAHLTIGRNHDNDLVLNDSMVSRYHAVIEARPTGFFLIDQSTNGTFVVVGDAEPVRLRRQSMQLVHQGRLSFGRNPAESNEVVIYDFQVG